MFLQDQPYSLLTVIVNRGKGSKVLRFVSKLGVTRASCLLGKGTIKNRTLDLIEMDEVNKEVILIIVPSDRENEILDKLNGKFHFDKPHHGIAFTMSLAGILNVRKGSSLRWISSKEAIRNYQDSDQTLVFLVVNKGMAENIIEISQDAGFYGGTIIKARGAASEFDIVLDMIVEPEKEAVLMITKRHRVNELVHLLDEELNFKKSNTGLIVMANINQTIGLFEEER